MVAAAFTVTDTMRARRRLAVHRRLRRHGRRRRRQAGVQGRRRARAGRCSARASTPPRSSACARSRPSASPSATSSTSRPSHRPRRQAGRRPGRTSASGSTRSTPRRRLNPLHIVDRALRDAAPARSSSTRRTAEDQQLKVGSSRDDRRRGRDAPRTASSASRASATSSRSARRTRRRVRPRDGADGAGPRPGEYDDILVAGRDGVVRRATLRERARRGAAGRRRRADRAANDRYQFSGLDTIVDIMRAVAARSSGSSRSSSAASRSPTPCRSRSPSARVSSGCCAWSAPRAPRCCGPCSSRRSSSACIASRGRHRRRLRPGRGHHVAVRRDGHGPAGRLDVARRRAPSSSPWWSASS